MSQPASADAKSVATTGDRLSFPFTRGDICELWLAVFSELAYFCQTPMSA